MKMLPLCNRLIKETHVALTSLDDNLVALYEKNASIIASMGRAAKNTMYVFEELEQYH